MITPEQKRLLNKLRKGRCTEEELEALFQIVKELPESEASSVMDQLWEQVQHYPSPEGKRSAKMYSEVLRRIDKKKGKEPFKTPRTERLKIRRRSLLAGASMAATFLVLLLALTWFWSHQDRETVLSTTFAERKTLELPDGSLVELNANSSLRFKENWNQKEDRTVWLEGEAFFQVKRKPTTKQKFLVVTNDLSVEVLGTAFNVNSRAEKTSVYLQEGKVALKLDHDPGKTKTMEPGELLTYSARQQQILKNSKDNSAGIHTSWKDGVMLFDEGNTFLPEALQRIEDHYGIQFDIQDPALREKKLTIQGLPMEELDIVIPILQDALQLNIEKQGDAYIIR